MNTYEQHSFFTTPPYVWPNPEIFPFRVYLDHPKLRIFLIDCIPHNWNWLSKYHSNFQDRDIFLVSSAWWGGALADNTRETFTALGMDKSRFIMLCNQQNEIDVFSEIGLTCVLVNNNAFLDDREHMGILPKIQKEYNAIYVGRRSPFKRHMLASKIDQLAIIAGNNHGNNVMPVPENLAFINDRVLNEQEVMEQINKAHCGLILSEIEGACYASSEYLLCGIPVVSTHSNGGRDLWYNEYNSIVCDPNEDAIKQAVDYFIDNPRDPYWIRQTHIKQSRGFRQTFIHMLQDLFDSFGVGLSAEDYFKEHFFHKMKKSIRVDFNTLFGAPVNNT